MSRNVVGRGDLASGAIFSSCERYRYVLWRAWDRTLPRCAFIGLNPSTADEIKLDPTVTRCVGYARAWGCGGLVMLNAFAYRATDPREMKQQTNAVGRPVQKGCHHEKQSR